MFIKVLGTVLLAFFLHGCGTSQYVYKPVGSSYVAPKAEIKNSPNMHRATMRPYTVMGKTYYPTSVSMGDYFSGVASWYGKDFHAKKTSNGEYYNMYDMTAAHKTLPMNTMLKVTNLKNDKTVVLRVNDRGPFVKSRIIDLSYAAASRLDVVAQGTAPVRIEVIGFNGVIGDMNKKQSVVMDNYLVQIGAFRNKDGAQRYTDANSYVENRYKAIIKEHKMGGLPLYRVWLSGFESEGEARDFIEGGKFGGAFIVRE